MKKKKWFSAIGEADEKYVAEADPTAPRRAKTLPWRRIAVVAACFLTLFTALNIYLFKPITVKPKDISGYKDSAYYGIIEKMNAYSTASSQNARYYKNNFRRLLAKGFLFGCTSSGDKDMSGGRDDAPNAEDYVEITDNQTAGVTEGDRIKRNGEYIYYLDGASLCVYSIAAEETEQVGRFDFAAVKEIGQPTYTAWEMYLSADGKTVTVVAPYYSNSGQGRVTAILSLDVSDPASITVKNKTFVSGSYISSRVLASGELLLMTRFEASTANYGDESSFIPSIGNGEESARLAPTDIIAPDIISNTAYTVLVRFDGETYEKKDSLAFLSYTDEVYVSAEHIFTIRTYQDEQKDNGRIFRTSMSEIAAVAYRDTALTCRGSFTVEGTVKDRYSLDEHEGMLRLVTTTGSTVLERKDDGVHSYLRTVESNPTNANLYVYDIASLTKRAEVIRFAPDGETVRSARFDGDTAYVCTAVALTDPVFFFDLSDLSHITYKETGTIEGYSTSLISLGDGLLLGIGYGNTSTTLKLELYRESGSAVVSVAQLEIERCSFSEIYKSYYIDRENGIIGIGIDEYGYSGRGDGYLVVGFDGGYLEELAFLRVYGEASLMRGCYIDGYFYAFGRSSVAVRKLEK